VLSDPVNRAKYDKYGKDWKHADEIEKAQKEQARQRASRQQYYGDYSEEDFSDFFGSMFGGGARRQSSGSVRFRGQDFHAGLQLNLDEVYHTHKRTLTVNGKNIRLTIPAGVKDGQVIKIKNHGGEGINGGPRGDLLITFSIINNTQFKRVENDLYTTFSLDLYKAVLGGEVVINTLDGKVKLKVKPETQNGTKVKLKGKGFPVYKHEGRFGDLYITYDIKLPTKLSEKEKTLFEELAKLRA